METQNTAGIEIRIVGDPALEVTRPFAKNQPIPAILLDIGNVPQKIGSGTVISTLGEGGVAVVYEIWNPRLELKRAVKLWRPNVPCDVLDRFETEIKITAQLSHPNIVEIHSVGEWEGRPFIEMEKIEGVTLKSLLEERGVIPAKVALAVSIMVCRALAYAHYRPYLLHGEERSGIIHCDIKPANIMIGQTGVVKVMDFGIATPIEHSADTKARDTVEGSLQYVAPELLDGAKPSPGSDIFSLTAILYEMLSGRKAFGDLDPSVLIPKRLANEYVPLADLNPKLPQRLRRVLDRGMMAVPESRIESVTELLSELEEIYGRMAGDSPEAIVRAFIGGKDSTSRRVMPAVRLPHAITAVVITAVLSFAAFISIGTVRTERTTSPGIQFGGPAPDQPLHSPARQPDGSPLASADPFPAVLPRDTLPAVGTPSPRVAGQRQMAADRSPIAKAPNAATPDPNAPRAIAEPTLSVTDGGEERARSVSAILSEIRAALSRGDLTETGALLQKTSIEDGEFYLLLARYLCESGQWSEALSMAERALRTPAQAMGPDQVTREFFFCRAKCLGAAFGAEPTPDRGRAAMEGWYDVKYQLRAMPDDPRYAYADRELRRISKQVAAN